MAYNANGWKDVASTFPTQKTGLHTETRSPSYAINCVCLQNQLNGLPKTIKKLKYLSNLKIRKIFGFLIFGELSRRPENNF